MKRLNLLLATAVLAVLPTTALAAPGGHLVGCGPAGDIAEPTGGVAILQTQDTTTGTKPAEETPAKVDQPQDSDKNELGVDDHDLLLICATAAIILFLIIIF